MRESKKKEVDEHNYNYWLEKNTKGQRVNLTAGRRRGSVKKNRVLDRITMGIAIAEAVGI